MKLLYLVIEEDFYASFQPKKKKNINLGIEKQVYRVQINSWKDSALLYLRQT